MSVTTTEYIISLRIDLGIEPCGRSEYRAESIILHDKESAIKLFDSINKTKRYMNEYVLSGVLHERQITTLDRFH